MTVIGAILAGGRGRRMGQEPKPLIPLGGKTLIEHVIDRLAPQTDVLAINANSDLDRYARFGLPLIRDAVAGRCGPLAGFHAILSWARTHEPAARSVVITASDTPFLPSHLFTALSPDDGKTTVIAASQQRPHWTTGRFPVAAVDALHAALTGPAVPRTQDWVRSRPHLFVDFQCVDGVDPFFNVNTPQELAAASEMLNP